ncbi:serine hydrolase FSH [Cercophora scortea]|uniref:Serine hydrolase FSH n=1 Tax=Cercophora scortea TaxID=314031 RepID=A0AAE0MMM9_9PEZI|nr:serine hydrolase FSH [Cercophora scortea]
MFCTSSSTTTMGDSGNGAQQQQQAPAAATTDTKAKGPWPAKTKPKAAEKKEVRILMLHGYTQSGPLFRAKTRAMEKLIAKALAPLNLVPVLFYPTAANRLSPRDIPGYQLPEGASAEDVEDADAWAWFRRDDASGAYLLLEEGMRALAASMAEANSASSSSSSEADTEGAASTVEAKGTDANAEDKVIDGVIGFSQGGAVAAMLASALEADRARIPRPHEGWVDALREANRGRPLKFAVVYSGFFAPPHDLTWLYEPKVKTPTLHYFGSLDTVVDESRGQGLVERCELPSVVVHPGGHYVPVNREWVMPVVGFVRKCMTEESNA